MNFDRRTLITIALFCVSCGEGPTIDNYLNFPPVVEIFFPDEGESIVEGTSLTVHGLVTDENDDAELDVSLSDDFGVIWEETDLASPFELMQPWTPLAGGPQICLYANDGRAKDPDDEACVKIDLIPSDDPWAIITEPTEGGTYYSDWPIEFEGQVGDTEDEPETLTVTWTSSIDGELEDLDTTPDQNGDLSGTTYLSEGIHTITLLVVDSTNREGDASVTIEVLPPNTDPTCLITEPEDDSAAEYGTCVDFAAEVSDEESADELWVTWESDLDGVLWEGQPDTDGATQFRICDLSAGYHRISLDVDDGAEGTCRDSIGYTVGRGPSCEILSPLDGATYYEGDSILFEAAVSDDTTPPTNLLIEWSSSEDDIFDESPADSLGSVQVAYSELSVANHTIKLTVTDDDGLWGTCVVTDVLVEDCLRSWYEDLDGDGYGDDATEMETCAPPSGYVTLGGDCDDGDPSIHPRAVESCDGVDEDCDGTIDNGFTYSDWYIDADSDGYGAQGSTPTNWCSAPSGYVSNDSDCDDADATINPAATETCDGVDEDCDGTVDDGVTYTTYYLDADWDGYGVTTTSTYECTPPTGFVTVAGDCDDGDATINPGATETCDGVDEDCDGIVDDGITYATYYRDTDGDGYGDSADTDYTCSPASGYVTTGGDCDESNASINPGATETCDGVDEDCDGTVDDGVTYATYYRDTDGDGYGDSADTDYTCAPSSGYVATGGDCDESNVTINPGATETCDGVDEDCDGTVDDGFVYSDWYPDSDGDGYGALGSTATSWCSAPSGYAANDSDCDDGDATIHPGATETCDGVDEDCDGTVDDGITYAIYYRDTDGDGYGDSSDSDYTCSPSSGFVTTGGDCDESDASINPGATEICDGVDQDCDGTADDGLTHAYSYPDADGDGYGASTGAVYDCTTPSGYVASSTDCDDSDASIHPGATETCDGVDEDCDGTADDGITYTTYYRDTDGDGYGDSSDSDYTCSPSAGFVTTGGDCDESDASINPGASEICDGIDQDCDSAVDEGLSHSYSYPDSDGDGYGASTGAVYDCATPSGYVSSSTDCDDSDTSIHPGATEVCDGVDQDCDHSIDEGLSYSYSYPDSDGDGYGASSGSVYDCTTPSGYVSSSSDCDDGDASIHPGATEICDGIDQDCDYSIDEGLSYRTYYYDGDGDGYGTTSPTTYDCTTPSGYSYYSTDCDDGDSSIHPGASESCDDEDNDCDGIIDDNTSCWKAIYRFIDPVSGAHCWDDDTTAPSACSGYTYELEAWIARANSSSNTWQAVQCSSGTDHIILEKYSSDYYALTSAGYSCSINLGYVYDLGAAPTSTTPYANTCDLYRFSGTTHTGTGEHLFTRGGDSTSGYTCEPPARGEVMTDHTCFSSAPSGCP